MTNWQGSEVVLGKKLGSTSIATSKRDVESFVMYELTQTDTSYLHHLLLRRKILEQHRISDSISSKYWTKFLLLLLGIKAGKEKDNMSIKEKGSDLSLK